MKKNLALLLALAMLFSCMLGLMPAAESATGGGDASESYEPKIAYANVNYSEDLVLMFAVPAPAADALPEGATVKVVLWTTAGRIYSYSEVGTKNADEKVITFALDAEETKVTIGGVEHLVFKYKGLTPEKMTDVIYARAAVVNKDNKAIAYSDVLDYSVVEYVETAKGGFSADGTPVIADEKVIGLLDSMLLFGATVQTFADKGNPYVPNGFYANEELRKIWVTPVVAGKKLAKVFGGFFKYEEGAYATVREPFFDGYAAAVYKDADGNVIEDAYPELHEEALGFQIDAVDADINVTIEYDLVALRQINAADYGSGFAMSNIEQKVYGTQAEGNGAGGWSGWSAYLRRVSGDAVGNATINFGGDFGAVGSWYNGIKTVEDPSNPGNYIFQIASSNAMYFSTTSNISSKGKIYYGYGDTLDKAVTFEVELGKTNPDDVVTINGIYLRDRSAWGGWAAGYAYDGAAPTENADLKKYTSSNLFSYLFRVIENDVILPGNNAKICTLPDTGLVKVAITVCDNNEIKAYYSNATGDMVYAGTWDAEAAMLMSNSYKDKHAQYLANLADDNNDNNDDLLPYKDIATFIEISDLELSMYLGPQGANATTYKSNNINNVVFKEELKNETVVIKEGEAPVPIWTGETFEKDGVVYPVYNPIALQAYMEQNKSFLMKALSVYVGDVYGVDVEEVDDESTFISVTGEDFGEGFAISNLTSKIGVIDGDPAKLAAMGATYDDPTKVSLNAYRFQKLFRRVWLEGTIGSVLNESKGYVSFFQGFKTVEDPYHPGNLVLQVATGNRTTLDLEIIKPEALANNGWGEGGAITLEFEIGQSNPNSGVTTRVFQLSRRTDENPDAGLSGTKNISIFTITDNKVYFTGNNANAETLIGEIPTTGFAKVAFVIHDTGVIKAYLRDANGNMVYAGEKDVSTYTNQLGNETFADWMKYVITTRWNIGEYIDAATVQAATVDINGVPTPVYENGVYNEAALQVYIETYHSFLLNNFKISGKALYK